MAAEKIDALELDINAKLTTENLDKLIVALGKLSKALDQVNAKRVNTDVKQTGDSAKEAAEKANILTSSFAGMAIKITALISAFKKLSDVISDGLSNSVTYIKTLNMFNVSLGEYAENATKYGNTVRDALGIDIAGWQSAQGIFQTLITGFGVSGDKAAYMSQQLTQLTYDIASFYNLTTEEAQNKVKAALSGRIEPIRKLGWDISQGKLVDIASNPQNYGKTTYAVNQETGALEANTEAVDDNTEHKIVNFNQLTQAEKVQLRYIALMTQVTQVQGNMAKTLQDPAAQMRIFKEQTTMTARALGNIFIPALNQVLPYVTAFAQVLEDTFQNIAAWFGFEIPDMSDRIGVANEVEYYDDIVEATGAAANNAKKLRDYTIGIDELNVLRPNDGGSGSGGTGGQQSDLNGLVTPGYDFLSKAIENSIQTARENLEKLRADFEAHPIQFIGEIGSNFWEKLLGMSPEELAEQARQHGRSVGAEFAAQCASRIGEVGSSIWTLILGKTPEELSLEASNNGMSVGKAFANSLGHSIATNPLFSISGIFEFFGKDSEIGQRAAEMGRTFAEQFFIEFAKKIVQLFDSNPILQEFYKIATGRDTEDDIKKLNKAIYGSTRTKNAQFAKTQYYNAKTNKNTSLGNTAADEARKRGEETIKAYAEGMEYAKREVQKAGEEVYEKAEKGVSKNGKGRANFKNISSSEAQSYADGLLSIKSAVENAGGSLFKSGYDGANDHGNGATKYKETSIGQATNYKDGLLSQISNALNAGGELYNAGLSGATDNGSGASKYGSESAKMVLSYVNTLVTKYAKDTAYNNAAEMAASGVSGAKSKTSGFRTAGENAGAGYVAGVKSYADGASEAGAKLGYNTLSALQKALRERSPSKATEEMGMYLDEGLAKGIERYTSTATKAAENMSELALRATGAIFTPGMSVSLPSSNAGYGIGSANTSAMASLASNIYQAVVSGLATLDLERGDTRIVIDGKEIFNVVQSEERKRGIAISNGAFST